MDILPAVIAVCVVAVGISAAGMAWGMGMSPVGILLVTISTLAVVALCSLGILALAY
jgi:hypothetical protein